MGSIFKQRNKQTGWEGDTWYIKYYRTGSPMLNAPSQQRGVMQSAFSSLEKGRLLKVDSPVCRLKEPA